MTHQVKVTRNERRHLWVIHVPAIRRTAESRNLRNVDDLVVRLIHETTKEPVSRIRLDYEFALPRSVRERLERGRRLRRTSVEAQAKATAEYRAVARYLHEAGMPLRNVGEVLGVSHQRAHQLLNRPVSSKD